MAEQEDSNWVSFSDIMTGLMVIFLFISIAFLRKVQIKQEEIERQNKIVKSISKEFYVNREALIKAFEKLEKELKTSKSGVKFDDVSFDRKALTFKFDSKDLFRSSSYQPSEKFQRQLDLFMPRFFAIILEYQEKIIEVRIEGHTDNAPLHSSGQYFKDSFMANIQLSQQRATNVLYGFQSSGYFRNLSGEEKELLRSKITANGLSYGRPVVSDPSADENRRVEFTVVSDFEEALEQIKFNLSE